MSEGYSFEVTPEAIEELKKAINHDELNAISERFDNGTETIDDIINHCRNYGIKFENGNQILVVEKKYFDKVIDLYQKEKERAERHKSLYLMEKDYQENKLNEYLTDKICERKFELQQEYRDFEDDVRLKTLEEIHKELLEEE